VKFLATQVLAITPKEKEKNFECGRIGVEINVEVDA